MRRRQLKLTLAVASASLMLLAACGSDSNDNSSSDTGAATATTAATGESTGGGGGGAGGSITVGSANFPENVLLGNIYAGALKAKGFDVSTKLNLGAREVIFPAMEKGDIDLLPEYTGSLLSFVLKQQGKSPTAKNIEEQVTELKASLPDKLTVLDPSTAEDKDVIVCNKETADKYNLKTLDDMAKVADNITLGGPPEFKTRSPFGIAGFKEVYGVDFKFKPLDVAGPLTIAALKDNTVNCANLFSTMSVITTNNFVPLDDTKRLIPGEAVIPFVAKAKVTDQLTSTLDAVSKALDTEGLSAMMVKIEVDKADPAQVAKDFLAEKGLDK
jgi:osmoprotectant transport system substrate-binding protein